MRGRVREPADGVRWQCGRGLDRAGRVVHRGGLDDHDVHHIDHHDHDGADHDVDHDLDRGSGSGIRSVGVARSVARRRNP